VSGSVPLTVRPVAEHAAAVAARAMEHCFEGYVVPIRLTPDSWERRFRAEHLDPWASRIYWRGDAPAAVLFVTRRGWTRRIGGMAVAASERGHGLGRRVLNDALADARAAGDRRVLLEVIEQNAPAVALYRDVGFRETRRLVGWRHAAAPDGAAENRMLREADVSEAARVVFAEADPGLPWMLAPETLAGLAAPAAAYTIGSDAWAVVSDPSAPVVSVLTLVVRAAERRRGRGAALVGALGARFAGRPLAITSIVPEGLAAGFLAATGWERHPLTQWEMEIDPTAACG
jgi:GNAT superfamily N-acetyltransferase